VNKALKIFLALTGAFLSNAIYATSFGLAIDGTDRGIIGKELQGAGQLGENVVQDVPPFANIGPDDPGWVDEDFDLVNDACDNDPKNHEDRFNLCTGQIQPMVLGARNNFCKLVTFPESAINQHHYGHVCGAGWFQASVKQNRVRIYIGGGRSIYRTRYSILPRQFANNCGPLVPSGVIQTAGQKTFGINFRNWITEGKRWAAKGEEWQGNKISDYFWSGRGLYATNFSWPTTTSDARANVCVKSAN